MLFKLPFNDSAFEIKKIEIKKLEISKLKKQNKELQNKINILEELLKYYLQDNKCLVKQVKYFEIKEQKHISERIAELLARRSRTVNSDKWGLADGERETEEENVRATTADRTASSRTARREYLERELEQRKQAVDRIQGAGSGSPETERADKIISEYQREQEV